MNGVLAIQQLIQLITDKAICSTKPIVHQQIQPNSLDLRLGAKAYRVRSSFISERQPVMSKVRELCMYELDLTQGAVLEKGKIYIIPLLESLDLPAQIHGYTNPKSSTGRLDIFTRVITDLNYRFNEVASGYHGNLFLEIAPRSFTILVREGDSLSQLRLVDGQDFKVTEDELRALYRQTPLLFDAEGDPIGLEKTKLRDGLFMGINLSSSDNHGVIGYKSRKNSELIDIGKIAFYPVDRFWEPVITPHDGHLILEPEEFYIFSSKERILIPEHICGEMIPYDTNSGELRTHYAGFFDSGFGNDDISKGAKVVLEVRSHDVPFLIEDEQTLFRVVFSRNAAIPDKLYGSEVNSNYQNQGLRLSKQFRDVCIGDDEKTISCNI
jgi:dCTP deaminase